MLEMIEPINAKKTKKPKIDPHKITDPLIIPFAALLTHELPHLGQDRAFDEISAPQSLHLINPMYS